MEIYKRKLGGSYTVDVSEREWQALTKINALFVSLFKPQNIILNHTERVRKGFHVQLN